MTKSASPCRTTFAREILNRTITLKPYVGTSQYTLQLRISEHPTELQSCAELCILVVRRGRKGLPYGNGNGRSEERNKEIFHLFGILRSVFLPSTNSVFCHGLR